MSKIAIQYFKTPYGELLLGAYADKLCLADWRYRKQRATIDTRIQKGLNASFVEAANPILQQAKAELSEYFKGERSSFDIPLLPVGSVFQKKVWQALQHVPFGERWSYQKLAQHLNNEKAIRAVAAANGANAVSIIIPCHRIVGSDGSLTGYAGGLSAKKKLLALEGGAERMELF